MMAVPSTFEELAAAVEAEAAMFEERSTDLHDRVNARAMNRMYAARLRALIPPAPEPIKVGDWVRGVDGTAESPSPEVGEGWRVPVNHAECLAALRSGVLEVWTVNLGWWRPSPTPAAGEQQHLARIAAGAIRVPSGWAEGRELVSVGQRVLGRAIGGDDIVKWSVSADDIHVMLRHKDFGHRVSADADGKVWVDPLPKQETETAEPHESEDPEELAAAVAAGLTVNPRPPGADWRDRQTYDGTVSAFRDALDYGFRYRIHGTVPGYGETEAGS